MYLPTLSRIAWLFALSFLADDGWAIRAGMGLGGAVDNMDQAEVALLTEPPKRVQ